LLLGVAPSGNISE
jgi:hypothetical protein